MKIWLVSLLSPIVKAHIFLNIKSDSWLSYREEMTIWNHYSFYVFSSANCRNPLGLESRKIPDGALWASSAFNKDFSMFGPQRARLRLDQPPRGYRADASSVDTNGSYITVDLGNDTVVTGVSTQGYGDTTVQEWVMPLYFPSFRKFTTKSRITSVSIQFLGDHTDVFQSP